jgi:pyridinium-3,5-bisthiocarboxylic acid mononucleotide nickel chelatase
MRHLHLDAIGGVAGDMFVAAMLDARPARGEACLRAAEAISGVPCRLLRHHDSVLAGARFSVIDEAAHRHDHAHTAWADIRARLHAAALPEGARRHALGIFSALAEAEARVHGIPPDAVTFHEVGAADSVADIVAAGWLIAAEADADGEATWSVGPLPLGGGQVRTAHGLIPLPAPATALLLEGFVTVDDGVGGERVTPTGAAILRHLGANAPAPPGARTLSCSGIGFGTRTLPGLSNVLRVLVSERAASDAGRGQMLRELAVIEFEVDDQTPEDLSIALDHLRQVEGVRDVLQMPAFGKKGRMSAHIQVLAEPAALEAAVAACFSETSTIGLRTRLTGARALPRESADVSVAGRTVRVKQVERPGGATAKAESDDLAEVGGYAARRCARAEAEQQDDE